MRHKALGEIAFAMNTSGKYLIIALHARQSGIADAKCGYRVIVVCFGPMAMVIHNINVLMYHCMPMQ